MASTVILGLPQDGTRRPALGRGMARPVVAASDCPRQNQKNLTPEARRKLFKRVTAYIQSAEDPVQQHLEQGHVHGTVNFLPWHRGFLRGFEDWQRLQTRKSNADFLPLAFWDTADPLPAEFPHAGRKKKIPSMPVPGKLQLGHGLEKLDFAKFTALLEKHHNDAHDNIGGDMIDPKVSPRDPIFWLFHAFYDHLYSDWQAVHPSEA